MTLPRRPRAALAWSGSGRIVVRKSSGDLPPFPGTTRVAGPRSARSRRFPVHLKDEELVTGLAGQEGGLDLLAATFARVATAVSFTRMLTPLGNYFIARPAARAAAGKITKETDVPLDAAVVLGLSAGALHVWSADPMLNQVGQYLGHGPLERMTTIAAT